MLIKIMEMGGVKSEITSSTKNQISNNIPMPTLNVMHYPSP
jgi:hypothetical protein